MSLNMSGRFLASWLLAGCCAVNAAPQLKMADQGHHARTANIDVVTYHTSVRDVVVLVGAMPAGDAMADHGNIAVPTLTGMMLDRGTRKLDKFAIAERLDALGAQISYTVGTQSLEIHAKCLKKDLALVLSLIAQELREPAFAAAEFAKAKQQFIGGLRESLQNPSGRAQEAFARAIFPEGHPNRPHSIEEYLSAAASASLEELKAFHAKYFGPKHMTLVIAGDVPETQARSEIAKDFAGWSGGQDYLRPAVPAAATAASEVQVPLKDKPSTSMILGQATGVRYRDPDTLPLRVGTAILGQGFTGRLMHTVRDKQGFTYGVAAGVIDDSIADGAFNISATFAPALLEKGLASTREVLATWWQDGITDDELAARKRGMVGSYAVGLSTTAGVAGFILISLQRGYDLPWLDEYPRAIEAITRDQVNRAIRAHLDPSKMVLVEAGSLGAAPSAPAVAPN